MTDGSVKFNKDSQVKVGNNTIVNTGNTEIEVDKDGNVVVPNGGAVTIGGIIYTSESNETIISVDEFGGVEITQGTASVPSGKEITANDNEYTTGDNGATITSNGELTDGSVKFNKDSQVKVGNNTIVNTGNTEIEVDKDGNVVAPNGGKLIVNSDEYITGDDTILNADEFGNITISTGFVEITNGESVTGNSGKKIESSNESNVIISTDKNSGKDSVKISDVGGKVVVDGTTYTSNSDDAVISINRNGVKTLENGSVKFDKGSKIKVGSNTITNAGNTTIEVDKDSKITMPNSGKVTIGGTTYTSESDGTIISVDDNGRVTISGGSTTIPNNKTISISDNTYTTNDERTTITSDGKITDGSVKFDKNSEIKVGNSNAVIKNDGNKTIVVDKDGNVVVPDGGIVVIDGKKYTTAGNDGVKFKVDNDGKVKIMQGATIAPDGKTQIAQNGSVVSESGNTLVNSGDTNSAITLITKDKKDYITVHAGGAVTIGDKKYVAGDKGMIYVIDEGSSVPNVIVSDSGIDSNLELVVTKQEIVPEKIQDKVKRDEITSTIYNVTLLKDGVNVQPDGELTIKLLIPEQGKERAFRIVHLYDDVACDVEYEIDGDYAVFTVDNLSEFSFVIDNSGSAWWLILILSLIVIAEIILIALQRKNDKKNTRLAGVIFGGVIPICEIVFLSMLGVAVVVLGAYLIYLYVKGKKLKEIAAENNAVAIDSAISEPEANKVIDDEAESELATKFNYSFTAKLILASEETKENFAQLTNYILSYKKVKARMSWNNLSINYGRVCLSKFAIRGEALWLYLALNPNDFVESKYRGDDFSGSARYAKVPYAVSITTESELNDAKELVDVLMSQFDITKGQEVSSYSASDYAVDSQENLVKRGLIKVYSNPRNTKEEIVKKVKIKTHSSIRVEEARQLLDDATARSLLVKADGSYGVKRGGGTIINLDTISAHFASGETVTLTILKEKGLVSKKETAVKILARGTIDKPLTIIADNFSTDAIKMIVLTGGKAIIGNC